MFPVSWLELIGFIVWWLNYSSFSIVLLLVMLLFDQWWMICGLLRSDGKP